MLSHSYSPHPPLAITMGEPAGVSPGVNVKALEHENVWRVGRPLVIGDT